MREEKTQDYKKSEVEWSGAKRSEFEKVYFSQNPSPSSSTSKQRKEEKKQCYNVT